MKGGIEEGIRAAMAWGGALHAPHERSCSLEVEPSVQQEKSVTRSWAGQCSPCGGWIRGEMRKRGVLKGMKLSKAVWQQQREEGNKPRCQMQMLNAGRHQAHLRRFQVLPRGSTRRGA